MGVKLSRAGGGEFNDLSTVLSHFATLQVRRISQHELSSGITVGRNFLVYKPCCQQGNDVPEKLAQGRLPAVRGEGKPKLRHGGDLHQRGRSPEGRPGR